MDVVQYNEDNRAFEVCERVHIVDHKHENDNQNKTVPVHEDSTKGITRVKESEKLKSKTWLVICWSVCVRQIRGWILSGPLESDYQ